MKKTNELRYVGRSCGGVQKSNLHILTTLQLGWASSCPQARTMDGLFRRFLEMAGRLLNPYTHAIDITNETNLLSYTIRAPSLLVGFGRNFETGPTFGVASAPISLPRRCCISANVATRAPSGSDPFVRGHAALGRMRPIAHRAHGAIHRFACGGISFRERQARALRRHCRPTVAARDEAAYRNTFRHLLPHFS